MLILSIVMLAMTPRAQATKAKLNNWSYIKLKNKKQNKTKNFCTTNKIIGKIKSQLREYEKIFPNYKYISNS